MGLLSPLEFWARRCGNCGRKVPGVANHCGGCGAVVSGGTLPCGGCKKPLAKDVEYCLGCGTPVSGGKSPFLTPERWVRHTGDLATRVEAGDLGSLIALTRALNVQQGTKALLLVNGAFVDTLVPGRHDLGGLLQRFKDWGKESRGTAILVGDGDEELGFAFTGVRTRDAVALEVKVAVVFRVKDAQDFLVNVMKDRTNVALSDVRQALWDELRNAVEEAVARVGVAEIRTSRAFKDDMEQTLLAHLRRTFQRSGYDFLQVRAVRFHNEAWGALQEAEGALTLADISLDQARRRAERIARQRDIVQGADMGEARSAELWKDFQHQLEKDGLFRGKEMEDLRRAALYEGATDEEKRRHVLDRLKVMQDLELRRIQLLEEGRLRSDQIEQDLADKRRVFETQLDLDDRAHKQRTDQERRETEADRDEAMMGLDVLERMKRIKLDQARAEAEIKRQEMQAAQQLDTDKLELFYAKDSSHLAGVLEEKARGMTAEERARFYERMLQMKDEGEARNRASLEKALELQATTTRIAHQTTGPGAAAGVGVGVGGGLRCPACRTVNQLDAIFCMQCGERLVRGPGEKDEQK